jgi:hypothetical protein
MNSEFHYYAIYFLCLRSGMDEARCADIAFASQYVDEAIVSYEADDGDGVAYRGLTTQNYIFWDEATLAEIYLPFHFVPGDLELARAQRVDGSASRWTVTPDSPLAKELLVAALRSGDDFRIGIALHAYADGWAHQHFSGRTEACNVVDPSSPLPPAGHLQALRAPDNPVGVWTDGRLAPELSRADNRLRFRAAAGKIYRYLRTSMRLPFAEESLVLDELSSIWVRHPEDPKARLACYTVDLGVAPYDKREKLEAAGLLAEDGEEQGSGGYDKLAWLKAEIARRSGSGSGTRSVRTRGLYRDSALRHWNEAAREHLALATSLLRKEKLL